MRLHNERDEHVVWNSEITRQWWSNPSTHLSQLLQCLLNLRTYKRTWGHEGMRWQGSLGLEWRWTGNITTPTTSRAINPVPQHCTKCRRELPLQIVPVAAKDLHPCGNLLSQNNSKRNLLILNTNLHHARPIFLHYGKTHSLIKIQCKLQLEVPENKVIRRCSSLQLLLPSTIRWDKMIIINLLRYMSKNILSNYSNQ